MIPAMKYTDRKSAQLTPLPPLPSQSPRAKKLLPKSEIDVSIAADLVHFGADLDLTIH